MSHKRHSHRHRYHHDKNVKSLPASTSPNAPSAPTDVSFTIDRKGDLQNLRYGSIDKHKVPKYCTVGYGRLIGLDRRFKTVSKTETERVIHDESLDPSSKNRGFPLLLRQQDKEASPITRVEPVDQDEITQQKDYIALGQKRRRLSQPKTKEDRDVLGLQSTQSAINTSLSDSNSDSDSGNSGSDSDDKPKPDEQNSFEIFRKHPVNQKYIELRNRTEKTPQDSSAWLDFIDHQEKYYLLTAGEDQKELGTFQRRAVTDMKISLYEKAIAVVKSGQGYEKLARGMMKEGAKIWDTDRQMKQWRQILASSNSTDLRYDFLSFQQTNPIAFSYEKVLEAYLDTFNVMSKLEHEDHDYHVAYLTLRLTTFIHEAGFSEKAIAIWQALLEYNCLRPVKGDDSMDTFAIFWESECPRVGEEGAKGWHSHQSQEIPSQIDDPAPDLNKNFSFLRWGDVESQRTAKDLMPARTLDNTIEDDPFRVILFSDVKDFIFRIKTQKAIFMLKQAFLQFCNLPPMNGESEKCWKWWSDPFLCNFGSEMVIGTINDTGVLFAPFDSPLHPWTGHCRSDTMGDFGVRVLTLLVEAGPVDEQLAEYVVAFRLVKSPSAARKFAKTQLKLHSDSLVLYNAYALVESRSDKPEAADNVWSTALSMSTSLNSGAQQYEIILWHCWIWELMERHQYARALNLLVEAMPSQIISPEVLQAESQSLNPSVGHRLRADAYFRERISQHVGRDYAQFVHHAALYALLKYLSSNHNFSEVVKVYQSTLSLMDRHHNPNAIEILHQYRARFAHFHAMSSHSGYKPMQLLTVSEESISVFPHNSIFVRLHERYLQRAGIVDRVRMLTSDKVAEVTSETSVLYFLYNIVKEISRSSYSGSTPHSVRRAFTKATSNDSEARSCASLWLAWIQFENSITSSRSGETMKQVRDVYMAALRSCPWSKDLYLQGFLTTALATTLKPQGLEQVYRSMSERGLRIRHDIIDILDAQNDSDS